MKNEPSSPATTDAMAENILSEDLIRIALKAAYRNFMATGAGREGEEKWDDMAGAVWKLVEAYVEETENRIINAEFAKTEAENNLTAALASSPANAPRVPEGALQRGSIIECISRPDYIHNLTLGKTYVVTAMKPNRNAIYVEILGDDSRGLTLLANMFRLATSPAPPAPASEHTK